MTLSLRCEKPTRNPVTIHQSRHKRKDNDCLSFNTFAQLLFALRESVRKGLKTPKT